MTERVVFLSATGPCLWRDQLDALGGIAELSTPDLTQDDAIAAMADRVLADTPGAFSAVGISMGGYLALEMFRIAPSRIRRLALINTTARAESERSAVSRSRRIASLEQKARQYTHPPDAYIEEALRWMVAPANLRAPAIRARAVEAITSIPVAAAHRQQQAMYGRRDQRDLLAAIDVPTLVIGGMQDRMYASEMSEEIAAGIAQARLEVLDPCGHFAPLEQPARVTALLRDWLAEGEKKPARQDRRAGEGGV